MLELKEQYEIALASLLHDIGKFKQRAFTGEESVLSNETKKMEGQLLRPNTYGGYGYRHALWTYDFFLVELFPLLKSMDLDISLNWENVARESASHHNPSGSQSISHIVSQADCASASNDRAMTEKFDDRHKYLQVPLRPIFSNISLREDKKQSQQSSMGYPMVSATYDALDSIFPVSSSGLALDYQGLWISFIEALKGIVTIRKIEGLLYKLKDLMYEYTWCIPSATNDYYNDISLYDHSVTTMTLAVALGNSKLSEKPLRMFSADLSGIQKFIFQSKYSSFPGAAKTFRGRSFLLSTLGLAYRLGLCKTLGLIPFVDCIDAGGRFTLLLPNNPELDGKIEAYQKKQEKFLLEKYLGTLCIVADWSMEVDLSDLNKSKFKETLKKASHLINLRKSRKFSLALKDSDFVMSTTDVTGNRCVACGVRSEMQKDGSRCSICEEQRELGEKLVSAKTFWLCSGHARYQILDSVGLSFENSLEPEGSFVRFRLHDESSSLPLWRLNSYTPEDEDFSEIAKVSVVKNDQGIEIGKPFLAYVKLDVDNLGEIFIHGFPEDTFTLSRYATLSRLLHHFFNVHVRTLLKSEFPHAYTVLSGGDDVFIIVPWTQAIRLVLQLNEDFKRFCCQSPDLHFSAGIVIGKSSTPFSLMNGKANIALDENAKEIGDRNCVCVFDTIFSYPETEKLLNDVQLIQKFLSDERYPVSTSFLYRMYTYVQDRLGKEERRKFSSISKMYYDLARNFTGKEETLEYRNEAAKFFIERFEFKTCEELKQFKVALIYAMYSLRKNNKEDSDNVTTN
ncbi:MAG: type III-A CRISPR-associated protein Cas10/Csm1 [Sphaerochaeta sp.]